jgi:hypothetical protein
LANFLSLGLDKSTEGTRERLRGVEALTRAVDGDSGATVDMTGGELDESLFIVVEVVAVVMGVGDEEGDVFCKSVTSETLGDDVDDVNNVDVHVGEELCNGGIVASAKDCFNCSKDDIDKREGCCEE